MQKCPVAGSFDEFAVIISCCDYRTSRLTPNDAEKYIYISRLKKRCHDGKIFILHLSYLRPLGIYTLYARVWDRGLARRIVEVDIAENEDLGRWGVPHPYLIDRIGVTPGGSIVFWWHWPPGVDMSDVYEWAERRGGFAARGFRVPVYTCKPRPRLEDAVELGKTLRRLLSVERVEIRAPALAYILLAGLDEHLFTPLKKLSSTTVIAAARDLERLYGLESGTIRFKYILQYYRRLSENYILGRYRVIDLQKISQGVTLVVELSDASLEEVERLYGLLAAHGNTAHMFYSPEEGLAMTTIAGADSKLLDALYQLVDHTKLRVEVKTRITGCAFPYELYNPAEDKWEEKPVPEFMELLRKMGYIR